MVLKKIKGLLQDELGVITETIKFYGYPEYAVIPYFQNDLNDEIKKTWQVCDGNNLKYANTSENVLNQNEEAIKTPNLIGNFIKGCNSTSEKKNNIQSSIFKLKSENIPTHTHDLNDIDQKKIHNNLELYNSNEKNVDLIQKKMNNLISKNKKDLQNLYFNYDVNNTARNKDTEYKSNVNHSLNNIDSNYITDYKPNTNTQLFQAVKVRSNLSNLESYYNDLSQKINNYKDTDVLEFDKADLSGLKSETLSSNYPNNDDDSDLKEIELDINPKHYTMIYIIKRPIKS